MKRLMTTRKRRWKRVRTMGSPWVQTGRRYSTRARAAIPTSAGSVSGNDGVSRDPRAGKPTAALYHLDPAAAGNDPVPEHLKAE